MGLRYRKRIKIAPGLSVNISKSGVSTSIGRNGATLNVGKQGARATVGIPGTGLSYSQRLTSNNDYTEHGHGNGEIDDFSWIGGLFTLLAFLGVLVIMIVIYCNL